MIEGGCFCKRVRYRIADGDYPSINCHCTMCRRIHAAPYVTWLVVPMASFAYTGQAPDELASSADGTRYFCSRCGTHVACMNTAHSEIIDVPVGSLDDPAPFRPASDIFVDSMLSWSRSFLP